MNPNQPVQPQQPQFPPAQPAPTPTTNQDSAQPQVQPIATTTQSQTSNTFGSQHKIAAFMDPSAPSTPPPPRSRKKIIISVAVVLVAGVVGAAAFAVTRPSAESQNTNASQTASSDPQQDDYKQTTTDGSLSDDFSLLSPPNFVIPSMSEWEVSDKNTDLNRIDHVGGCSMTFSQLKERKNQEQSDAEATDATINNMLEDLRTNGTVSEITEDTVRLPVTDSDKTVEFKTTTFKYSTDLAEYKQIATVRSIDGYVMGVRFFCATPAFSQALNNQAVEKLTITLEERP